jgi:hypothetical protein
MSEQKLFYTVCATLLMYGLGSYMQLGSFILPLPFFETGMLMISIFLAFKMRKENLKLFVVILLFGLFQFLSLEYNYSFFLPDQSLTQLSNSPITDIFKVISHLILLGILFFQNQVCSVISNRNVFAIISFLLLITIFIPGNIWFIIPVFFINVMTIQKDVLFQKSYSFWLYLPLFAIARELSLYFL